MREEKLLPFANDVVRHMGNPEESSKKLLELINIMKYRVQNQHTKISSTSTH